MGIVRFALRFPHTFYVLAALILFLGVTAITAMPTDIFPEIDIPVVTVIWQYTGLSTPEMEERVTTYSQYAISSNVNGIKDMEAQTLDGLSVQKIYFQPDVNLDLAISQIVSATNSVRALMPAGVQPPIVVQFNASSVPVMQVSLSSDSLNEQQLYDYGIYRVRQQLAPVPGVTLPTPAGGKYRQIMVDIDPAKLLARGLTPMDVVNAVNSQNLTLPSGTAKIGDKHSGAICRRRDRLRKGRRAGPRRLHGAAKHRARGRQAIGPAQHHQERQRIDARRSQGRESRAEYGARRRSGWDEYHRIVRSVGVRHLLDRGRGA
jgi:multidrug efflux pump subunit AcrB